MSDTIRKGTVTERGIFFTDRFYTFNKYWYHHDPSWYRRNLNRKFRREERQYFQRFGETLRPSKNRGWYW